MQQAAPRLGDPPATSPLRLVDPDPAEAAPPRPEAPAVPAPPPERRLELPAADLAATLHLQHELGIGRVLAHVLVRRGLAEPERARAFLEPGESHPPAAFAGIETAVALVRAHLGRGSRIV